MVEKTASFVDDLINLLANKLQIGDRTKDRKWTVKDLRVTSGGNAVVTWIRTDKALVVEREFTYSPRASLDVFREPEPNVTNEELNEMRTGLETWLK